MLEEAAKSIQGYSPDKQMTILLASSDRAFSITNKDILGKSREAEVVTARWMLWNTFLRNQEQQLGRRFLEKKFNRDRVTILHGIIEYIKRQGEDAELKLSEEGYSNAVRELSREVQQHEASLASHTQESRTTSVSNQEREQPTL